MCLFVLWLSDEKVSVMVIGFSSLQEDAEWCVLSLYVLKQGVEKAAEEYAEKIIPIK